MMSLDSAARLEAYLRGPWGLVKRVEYRRGGEFGTWRGDAVFECVAERELRLVEKGNFFFDANPTRGVGLAAKPLTFDLRRRPVEVLFPEGPFHTLDADALMEAPSECSFTHLCGADTYRGTMRIFNADHFSIGWSISGPYKDGTIHQDYSRRS